MYVSGRGTSVHVYVYVQACLVCVCVCVCSCLHVFLCMGKCMCVILKHVLLRMLVGIKRKNRAGKMNALCVHCVGVQWKGKSRHGNCLTLSRVTTSSHHFSEQNRKENIFFCVKIYIVDTSSVLRLFSPQTLSCTNPKFTQPNSRSLQILQKAR